MRDAYQRLPSKAKIFISRGHDLRSHEKRHREVQLGRTRCLLLSQIKYNTSIERGMLAGGCTCSYGILYFM